MGTKKTMAICVLGQLGATMVAALTLWALRRTSWPWIHELLLMRDVGFSAGMLACAAVLTAALRPPWRLRIRVALCTYIGVAVLFVGALADLEHLLAVAVALPLGPWLVGRRHTRAAPSRREWRLLAVTGLVVICAAEIVVWIVPSVGPLGSTKGTEIAALGIVLDVATIGLVMNGLRKGRRLAWWFAFGLASFNVLRAVAAAAYGVYVLSFDRSSNLDGVGLTIASGLLWAAELVLLVAARRAFRVPWRRRGMPGATDESVATNLLLRYGGGTMSWMTTWRENSYFLAKDGSGFVAYQRQAGVAITVGGPVGSSPCRGRIVGEFSAMCERSGLTPCLFSIDASTAAVAADLGWQLAQVAEDTLIDLQTLNFTGKKWQDVRSAFNRATKEGISYRESVLADQPWAVLAQVRAISAEWVGDKGLPEMGFTLGGVDEAMDRHVRVGLAVDSEGSLHGITSWLPVYGAHGVAVGWTLDVMRRRTGGFRPVMEFLIGSACLSFQEQGMSFLSLSGAPLARSSRGGATPAAVERMLDSLGSSMEPVYGFRSLHAFKTKFCPRYEPMYMAYRDEADLPRIGIAIARAYLPTARVRDLVKISTMRTH